MPLLESMLLSVFANPCRNWTFQRFATLLPWLPSATLANLSNDTIHRRILDLSENIDANVQKKIEGSKLALIVDESSDISNSTQLLVFVRFIDDYEIIIQFLCCIEMPTTNSGQDIFDMITGYHEKVNLTWKFYVGICTDGVSCMVGCIKGFASLAQR